jgi:MFS superfamily sulfate permease-like transporter
MRSVSNPFTNLKYDLPASVVVFLVALPLCLGIALASGAPMLSGIIAGVVGGIVVAFLSGSHLSVSGPAAGLTTIVLAALTDLGSFDAFLCAVIVAGVFQFILGTVRAGTIGHFFPVSVIKGMLSAIGLILILKQIPHALGYDRDFEGDESFLQADGENTFSEIINAINFLTPGAIVISVLSIALLLVWEKPLIRKNKVLQYIPGPLLVVLVGVLLNILFASSLPQLVISEEHLVSLPKADDLVNEMVFPDFSQLLNPKIYTLAITLGLVASLESLLCIEAADRLDPFKRITPLNRELRSQGIGNIVSGLLGGLPVTAVIVRSSANINAGARTKFSAILHGILLCSAVVTIPHVLNLIPFSSLAAILIVTGFKLTKPSLFREIFRKGWDQFVPFVVTIVAILLSNLLLGIFIGIAVGIFYVLKTNFQEAISFMENDDHFLLRLNKDVSFLNKAVLRRTFERIPEGATVVIDGGNSQFIDTDIAETIEDFVLNAPGRNIQVELRKSHDASNEFFKIKNDDATRAA